MKNKQLILLMAILVLGLFSVAYADTVLNVAETELSKANAESPTAVIVSPVVPAIVAAAPMLPAPPAPPALPRTGEVISWWQGGNAAIPFGKSITLVDVWTGKSFQAIRTYGHNHADMETASLADTRIMMSIWGGSWNWERRPMVAIVDGRSIAVSCAGMPHAGLDAPPAEVTVSNRSGGFGRGLNLDKIKGNGMEGHFDLHLLNSKTHGTGRVDPRHQAMIKISGGQ